MCLSECPNGFAKSVYGTCIETKDCDSNKFMYVIDNEC
jgi:hypothetical protein